MCSTPELKQAHDEIAGQRGVWELLKIRADGEGAGLTYKHHEQAAVQDNCVEAFPLHYKGGEGPEGE